MIPNLLAFEIHPGPREPQEPARAAGGLGRTTSRCVGAGGAGRGHRPDFWALPRRGVVGAHRASSSAFRLDLDPRLPSPVTASPARSSRSVRSRQRRSSRHHRRVWVLTTISKTVRATAISLAHFPRAAEYSRLHHRSPLPRVRLPEANPRSTRASARFAPFSSTATLRRRAAPAAAARGCAERHALPPGEARAAAQVLPRSGAVLRRAVLLEEP